MPTYPYLERRLPFRPRRAKRVQIHVTLEGVVADMLEHELATRIVEGSGTTKGEIVEEALRLLLTLRIDGETLDAVRAHLDGIGRNTPEGRSEFWSRAAALALARDRDILLSTEAATAS